jgi:hypothetical protein
MTDRIDSSHWPSPRGPWPEVTDASRLYDHGRPWCVNADAHPDRTGGYPDPDRHVPWHECQTAETYIDGTRRNLDGEPVDVSVYAAAPFRFGELRGQGALSSAGIVIETWPTGTDEPAERVSLTPGEALRLARILIHLADQLTLTRPATP